MVGLLPFGDAKPKPKRKRKSRAKKRPESDSGGGGGTAPPMLQRTGAGMDGSSSIPRLGSSEQLTPQDRQRQPKDRTSPVLNSAAGGGASSDHTTQSGGGQPSQQDKKPKRRCRKRDPAEQPSQPWSEEEIAQFRALVEAEGATAWKDKAVKLARLSGNLRTPKALHTRYLRQIGRIVDRPRYASLLQGCRLLLPVAGAVLIRRGRH